MNIQRKLALCLRIPSMLVFALWFLAPAFAAAQDAEPRRFSGWFQPLSLALLVVVPLVLLLLERWPDLKRDIESKRWKARAKQDSDQGR